MTQSLPRTRGLDKAGHFVASLVNDADSLLRLDEFATAEGREAVRRLWNAARSLQAIRDADRRAGLHRGGDPFEFAPIPADDHDLLPAMPAASGPFPVACDF